MDYPATYRDILHFCIRRFSTSPFRSWVIFNWNSPIIIMHIQPPARLYAAH